jgi:hypothetical protein
MSEFTVIFWIHTFTALIDVETLTALLTKAGFIFLTGGNGLTLWMISTLHFYFPLMSKIQN